MATKDTRTARTRKAAEELRQQEREERRRRATMVGGVVALLLAVVVGGTLWVRASDPTRDLSAPAAGTAYGVTVGDPGAPHEVVVYEDFLCPFCGDLEAASREDLARLAEEGKVYVEYRPFELLSQYGDYSARATNAFAVVLEEAGPEVAKRYHDLLFEEQPSESGPFPDDDALVALAVEAGAEEEAVRPGIEGMAQREWVEEATRSAQEAGVPGTPTVLLDGEVFQEGGSMAELAESLVARLE